MIVLERQVHQLIAKRFAQFRVRHLAELASFLAVMHRSERRQPGTLHRFSETNRTTGEFPEIQ
jgi:hypothetical protein